MEYGYILHTYIMVHVGNYPFQQVYIINNKIIIINMHMHTCKYTSRPYTTGLYISAPENDVMKQKCSAVDQ